MIFRLLEGIMGMVHTTQNDECGEEEKIKISLLTGILTIRLSNWGFEQYVLHCDALVIVYGEVSVKWVSDQLLAIRKISWKREQPLTAFAIFDGPPPQKPL